MSVPKSNLESASMLELTVAQRGMWIADKIAPSDTIFNLAEAIEIHGAIDADLFVRALADVAAEAETTRVMIAETPSGPRQMVQPIYPYHFPVTDLAFAEDPWAEAQAWMWRELATSLDLKDGCLWMGALLRLSSDRWIWYHRAHHIIYDGFTGGMIARRVAEIYTARVEKRPPAPCPFAPLATLLSQEREYRSSKRFEKDRTYWLQALADVPMPVTLASRRGANAGGLRRNTVYLSAADAAQLRALAKQWGGSLPQVLIALVATYYHRATGVDDLIIGMPVTGRNSALLRSVPGMMANAVPLRIRFSQGMSFAALIHETGRVLLRALRHQQFRYEELRRDLGLFGPDQQLSWLGVNIEPFDYTLDFGGHQATTHNMSNGSIEDLMIFIYDRLDERGLRIDLDANPALYEQQDLMIHGARLLHVIEQAIANPEISVKDFDLFQPGERQRLLCEWNNTSSPPPEKTALERIISVARQFSDSCAVIDGIGLMTYGALLAEVDKFAERLRCCNAGPGSLIGFALPRDRRTIIAMLAIMQVGAAYLPLDPTWPRHRLELLLSEARPFMLIVSNDTCGYLTSLNYSYLNIDTAGSPVNGDIVPAGVPVEAAYVIFTSGSTGGPKGVVVGKDGLENILTFFESKLALSRQDRLLAVTAVGFDIAAIELLLPLLSGAVIVIANHFEVRDPKALSDLIRRHQITTIQATPSVYKLFALIAADSAGLEALNGLTLLVGGEMLTPSLAKELGSRAKRLLNVYGPTETTIWSTVREMTEPDYAAPPVGEPIANTRVYVLDRDGNLVPPGIIGEIYIGGSGVALGYLGRSDLTETRFLEDRFVADGSFMFRTGDMGRFREDGALECLGRNDEQIKIRGFRVEPGEIETTLAALPSVIAAVVMPREVNGQKQMVAYCVPRDGHTLKPEELRCALEGLLPDYMIPGAFVSIATIPLTANGKIDRAALPDPAAGSRVIATEFIAPKTQGERILAEIWARTFGLEKISVNDNFFALGGDSLLAVTMIAELAQRFNFDLPVGAVFQDATIANLAPYLEGGIAADPLKILIKLHGGNHRNLFCVHPVAGLSWGYAGLARHLSRGRAIYGLQSIGFGGALPSSIEDLATAYLTEITKVQPAGPYALLGWSFGGLVAHEMARQLYDDGKSVEFLALMDAYPFRTKGGERSAEISGMVKASLSFLGYSDEQAGGINSMDDLADRLAQNYEIPNIPLGGVDTIETVISRVRELTMNSLSIAQNFIPGHVPTDMIFFRARDRAPGAGREFVMDSPEAWTQHVGGRISVHDIECKHQDMLQPRPLSEIGQIISDSL